MHVVDESLLSSASPAGELPPESVALLDRRLEELSGADVILCTCSTIGGYAERADAGVPVLRIDRPLAEAAVARAGENGRIALVVTVESTIAPTLALFPESAGVVPSYCPGAWDLFTAGDLDGYANKIAEHCRAIAPGFGVLALAQASAAPAAAYLTDLPVLTTPRAAMDAILAMLGRDE